MDGKQIRDATVTQAKLAAAFLATLFLKDGSVSLTGAMNAGSQRITNLGAPVNDTDAARLADLYSMAWKDKCVVATTGNITLSGTQTIDGIAVIAGDRVLVRAQTLGENNGIYIVAAGAWSRSADADSAGELRAAVVTIEKGTINADKRFALSTDSIVLGTTVQTWVDIGTGTPAAFAVSSNKQMTASVTSADFQAATAVTLVATPSNDAYVRVLVNGIGVTLGDGVRTKDCYFSSDGGTTAKTIANIAAGDTLYWVQSVAGYNLAATDVLDFDYAV
jgi:hypothetical protein